MNLRKDALIPGRVFLLIDFRHPDDDVVKPGDTRFLAGAKPLLWGIFSWFVLAAFLQFIVRMHSQQ